MPFYPNECFVCKATSPLKRCSRCNMISYCGEEHQKKDWKFHQKVCKVISSLLKERGLSHIYQDLKGVDKKTWKKVREELHQAVRLQLSRRLTIEEIDMFQFPRVCFVCYEARQDLLRNCPNCPLASFCKEHPSSEAHDKICSSIKQCHDLETGADPTAEIISVTTLTVVGFTSMEKTAKPPTSMQTYLNQNLRPEYKLSESVKYYISECLSIPLTLYNAFRKLDQPVKSEMVIHVQGIGSLYAFTNCWETLLHLLPDIDSLTIILTDQDRNLKMSMRVCNKCIFKNKRLFIEGITMSHMEYSEEKFYKKPDMLAVYNLSPQDDDMQQMTVLQVVLASWVSLPCPIVLSVCKENRARIITECMRPTFWNNLICYNGRNEFAPLYPKREWEDWGLCKSYEFIIVARAPGSGPVSVNQKVEISNGKSFLEDSYAQSVNSLIETRREIWRKSFYASSCHVCRALNASITCKRCKMIFYCTEHHQKVHWPMHKTICKIILGMLNKSEAPNLFDKLKTDNEDLWLKAKIDLLKSAELKLEGRLPDDEREMFLFPKTCFTCHESDLSLLRNCECGVSFCKMHEDNAKHKELCREFSISRSLMMLGDPPIMKMNLLVIRRKPEMLPESLEAFMKTYLRPTEKELRTNIPNLRDILLSESLSRALTFINCIDHHLDPCYTEESDSLTIHVIGSIRKEIEEMHFWKFVSWWLEHLRRITIIFLGPELGKLCPPSYLETGLNFPDSPHVEKVDMKIEIHALKYEDYYRSEFFIQPDIVIGFNLNIHECELGMTECTWKETMLVLSELRVPFIMTAGSRARALKDDERFCTLLENDINCSSPEENPYASLIPERDFETEELLYSNKYILIYREIHPGKKYEPPKPQRTIEEIDQDLTKLRLSFKNSASFAALQNGEPGRKILKARSYKSAKVDGKSNISKSENNEVKESDMDGNLTVRKEPECRNNKSEIKKNEVQPSENKKTETKEDQRKILVKKNIASGATEIEKEEPVAKVENNVNDSEPEHSNIELFEEISSPKGDSKALSDNLLLNEENRKLKEEHQNLKLENEKLRKENEMLRDIRNEVQECIRSVMNSKK